METTKHIARKPSPRGVMLVEIAVSIALLAGLLLLVSQVIVLVQRQTKLVEGHYLAQQALENLLEEAIQQPWTALTTETVNQLAIPDYLQSRLPNVRLAGEVVDENKPVEAKRVTLQLVWQAESREQNKPLSLTTWVYQQPAETR